MPAKKQATEKLGFVPKVRSQRKQARDKRKQVKAKSRVVMVPLSSAPISPKDAVTETPQFELFTLRVVHPSDGRRKHLSLHAYASRAQALGNRRPALKAHVLDRGAFVCFCCSREFAEQMHLLSHYLMHTPEELSKESIFEKEVLRYINEQYPRLEDEKTYNSDFELGKRPIGQLLALNSEPNDGFSGYLLRTLPDLAKKAYATDGCYEFNGLCEPNHWLLYCAYVQREPGYRGLYKWLPTFAETDLDVNFPYDEHHKPIALVADGTFMNYESPDERVAYEAGAMLALVAGGVWKRHAVAHGANSGKQLAYVGWNTVRQQLHDDGRGELAELFDAFFRDGRYKEKLDELLEKIGERDWGFAGEWVELK